MKKYISADLRVINCANDIIATSGDPQTMSLDWDNSTGEESSVGTAGRRGWDEF